MEESTRKTIILSIIASVIVLVFIEPLLKLAWKIIIWLGENLYSGISSYFISQISVGSSNITPLFFAAFVLVITLIPLAAIIRKRFNKESESDDIKPSYVTYYVAVITFFIIGLFVTTHVFVTYVYNVRFNQYINIVTPYISQSNVHILNSKWSSMETVDDFIIVDNEINEIFIKHKLRRPDWWD